MTIGAREADPRSQQKRGNMGFLDILSWIIVGLIAGVIAKILMPGKDPGGCAITMLLGIGGAVLAGFLAHYLNLTRKTEGFGDTGFFAKIGFGVIGALIILAIYRLIAGRRA
jgi:uncharacterized membrane protein YeaQ/YmgE (transglycosylase-associated protein family)